jgi:hypothetical protein
VLGVCIGMLGGWVGSGTKDGHIFEGVVFGKLKARLLQRNGTGIKSRAIVRKDDCVLRELQSGSCPTPGDARVWTGWHRDRKYWGKDRRGGFCSELG